MEKSLGLSSYCCAKNSDKSGFVQDENVFPRVALTVGEFGGRKKHGDLSNDCVHCREETRIPCTLLAETPGVGTAAVSKSWQTVV